MILECSNRLSGLRKNEGKGRMRKVKFYLEAQFAYGTCEEVMEFDDNITDDEISEIFHDWYESKLDTLWWDIEE